MRTADVDPLVDGVNHIRLLADEFVSRRLVPRYRQVAQVSHRLIGRDPCGNRDAGKVQPRRQALTLRDQLRLRDGSPRIPLDKLSTLMFDPLASHFVRPPRRCRQGTAYLADGRVGQIKLRELRNDRDFPRCGQQPFG